MSLIERVQGGRRFPEGGADSRRIEVKSVAKDLLYLTVSPERIARMVEDNPAAARRELSDALDRVLASDEIGALPLELRMRLRTELINDILGLGPLEDLLQDPTVTEVMVNGPKNVFYERDGLLVRSDTEFDDNEHVMRVVERIVSPLGRRVDERSPMVNARLPEGHRVNVIIPPLALNGPTITIRKFRTAIYDLPELVRMGSLPPGLAQLLSWAVRSRLNIAVTGGTGSGKTTLLNALSIEIPVSERILTVEDSAELKFQRHPHVVSLEGRPSNIEGEGEVSIRDLVINALRMRPDRIVVGEVRGGEALDMLQAMNTGHDGSLTTLHANSPDEAVARLVTMVRYVADLPVSAIHEQIAGAIQLFVHQSRMSDGTRRVTHVVQTAGVTERGVKLEPLVLYRQQGVNSEGRVYGEYEVTASPAFLERVVKSGLATQAEVDAWALDR